MFWIISNNTHCFTIHSGKPNDKILGKIGHYFKKISFVDDLKEECWYELHEKATGAFERYLENDVGHVVRSSTFQWDNGIQTVHRSVPVEERTSFG